MFYGFYKWFLSRKINTVSEENNFILKSNYILIFVDEKNEKLEKHIRIDKYGSLLNKNLPEAHLTLKVGLFNVRINKNTSNSKKDVIKSINGKSSILSDENEIETYSRHLVRENDLLDLYIEEYNIEKNLLLNELQQNELELSRLSSFFVNSKNIEEKRGILEQYKNKMSIFKDSELELNSILDEVSQLNNYFLIEKIYNKLEQDLLNQELLSIKNVENRNVELKTQEETTQKAVLDQNLEDKIEQDLADEKINILNLDIITEDNLGQVIDLINKAPDFITSSDYLMIIDKVKNYVLNLNRGIDDITMLWASQSTIMNDLEIIYDEKVSDEEKLITIKKWENSPCIKKAIQEFCVTLVPGKNNKMVSPLHFLAINNKLELFKLFLFLGANVKEVGFAINGNSIDLEYSLLTEDIEESFYLAFLEYYPSSFIKNNKNHLQLRMNLAKIRSKSRDMIDCFNYSASSPLRLCVSRGFFNSVGLILSKSKDFLDIIISFSALLEYGKVRYLQDRYVDHHFVILENDHDLDLITNRLKNVCRNLYNNTNYKIRCFLNLPKITILFHSFDENRYKMMSFFIKFMNSLNFDKIEDLILQSRNNKVMPKDSYYIAKSTIYLCLIKLESQDINGSLNFYKKWALIMQKCVENLLDILKNKLILSSKRGIDAINVSKIFFGDFLKSLKTYNNPTDSKALDTKAIDKAPEFKHDSKCKESQNNGKKKKNKKRAKRRGRRR